MASTSGSISNVNSGSSTSNKRNRSSASGGGGNHTKKEKERSNKKLSDGDDAERETASNNSRRSRNRKVSSSTSSSSPERDGKEEFTREGWECTVCTFQNPSEAFRCEMCDIRKGTSTRKPRLNSTVVEQQQTVQKFVQQQQAAMMAQANREKRTTSTSEKQPPSSSSSINGAGGNFTNFGLSPPQTPSSTISTTSSTCGSGDVKGQGGGAGGILGAGCCSPSLSLSPSCSKTPPLLSATALTSGHFTPSPALSLPPPASNSPYAVGRSHQHGIFANVAACASSPSPSPSPSLSSVSRKLLFAGGDASAVSAQRQISRGRISKLANSASSRNSKKLTAFAAKSKSVRTAKNPNVDQNSARTLAVTVNGITVVITDYKLRPNENGVGPREDNGPGCSNASGSSTPKPENDHIKKRTNGNDESKKRRSAVSGGKPAKKRKSSTSAAKREEKLESRRILSDDEGGQEDTRKSNANNGQEMNLLGEPDFDGVDAADEKKDNSKKKKNPKSSSAPKIKSGKSKAISEPIDKSNGQDSQDKQSAR